MESPSLNTWTVIFLIAGAQGLFLSLLLVLKRSMAQYLLAGLILLFSTCLFYYVAYWTGYLPYLPRIAGLCLGINYLLGPLLYFYIRSRNNKVYFRELHLLPFLLYVLYFLYQNYVAESRNISFDTAQIIIQNAHLFFYAFAIHRFVRSTGSGNSTHSLYRWRKQLAASFTGYVISFLSYYILVWSGWLRIEYDYMISMSSCIFIYFVGYKGFVNSELFNHYDRPRYGRSSLSKRASDAILDELKSYFNHEKPYLQSNLKLGDVASKTSFSSHHISQSLNETEGVSFSDFVNKYRFEEARKILSSPESVGLRIIDVAYDSGFNNKTTFTNVFKRYEGMTPGEYRDRLLKIT